MTSPTTDHPGSVQSAATIGGGDAPFVPSDKSPDGFELISELGRGGMGVVYKARQLRLNRIVALKMVLSRGLSDRLESVRFLIEAEALAAVSHPHVVQVFEFDNMGDCPYLVMEYLDGGSLSAVIQSRGRLPPLEAATLVEKIARGVHAAHEHGIVHRDIKPANILFDTSGVPKVADFGLAKRGTGGDLTETNAIMGTPAYMSPEQAAGQTKFVGPSADVYSLGVILYECLTGTVPFQGGSAFEVVRQVVFDTPDSLRKRVPDLHRDLELICQRCMEKEPLSRYPTAAALADDLQKFAAGEPVSVRSPSLVAVVRQWTRKQFGSAGWTIAGGVVTGAAAGANVLLDMFGRKVPLARAEFERLALGATSSARSVSDSLIAVVEGLLMLLAAVSYFLTSALVRPKNRSADIAAGLLTGVISAVTFFTISFAWWGVYSLAVRPAVGDLVALGDPTQAAVLEHPAVADIPPDARRATLAAKVHNDLIVHIPWAILSGMFLAATLTVPLAGVLVSAAGGLIRDRGMRWSLIPLYFEIALPTIVFCAHLFFLLCRALWYGMQPQHPLMYLGLLAVCGFAMSQAWRGGRWPGRAAAQVVWFSYYIVTTSQILYEFE